MSRSVALALVALFVAANGAAADLDANASQGAETGSVSGAEGPDAQSPDPGSEDAEPEAETIDAIALCSSTDPNARSYCVEQIRRAGAPPTPAARRALQALLDDPEVGELATEVLAWLDSDDALEAAADPDTARPDRDVRFDSGRMFLSPTAFLLEPGERRVQVPNLLAALFSFGVLDHVEVELQVMPPFGVLGGGTGFRAGGGRGLVRFAVIGNFAGGVLFDTAEGGAVVTGGAALTVGTEDAHLNLGTFVTHGPLNAYGGVTTFSTSLGGTVRVARRLRLKAEGVIWATLEPGSAPYGLSLPGVQVGSRRVWGDVALAFPIGDGALDFYRDLPFGMPFGSVGVRW